MTWLFIMFEMDLNQRFGRTADEIGGSVERDCAQVLAPSTIEWKSPQGAIPHPQSRDCLISLTNL
jgi:hypothetical protein